MKPNKIDKTEVRAQPADTLAVPCPKCGAVIDADPAETGLYCTECKRIIMQNPIAAAWSA